MQQLKTTIFPVLATLICLTVRGQAVKPGRCQIRGTIQGITSGKVKLDAVVFGQNVSFDSPVSAGTFEFSINQPSPTAYTLYLPEKPALGSVTLFCENGTL